MEVKIFCRLFSIFDVFIGSKSPLLVHERQDVEKVDRENSNKAISYDPSGGNKDERKLDVPYNEDIDMATYEAQLKESTQALLIADKSMDSLFSNFFKINSNTERFFSFNSVEDSRTKYAFKIFKKQNSSEKKLLVSNTQDR